MNFYATIGQLNAFADGIGESRWADLSVQEKTLVLHYANNDIERAHGQPRPQFNIPWQLGNVDLTEATKYQTMHVLRTRGAREFKEQAKEITKNSYSDGIVSISQLDGGEIDPIAMKLINRTLATFGTIKAGEFLRG